MSVLVEGAAVCTGAALWPDIDHPESRVSNSVGPLTRMFARAVAELGQAVHGLTRTRLDPPDLDGHRTVSHIGLAAVFVGAVVAWLGRYGGPPAAAVLVFATSHLGLQAALPWRMKRLRLRWRTRVGRRWRTRRVTVPVPLTVAVALGAAAGLAAPGSTWWLGVAVAAGLVIHCLGDMLTGHGVPFIAPLKVRGRRWFKVAVPKRWRFATGGKFEVQVMYPLLALQAALAVLWLMYPTVQTWWFAVDGAGWSTVGGR